MSIAYDKAITIGGRLLDLGIEDRPAMRLQKVPFEIMVVTSPIAFSFSDAPCILSSVQAVFVPPRPTTYYLSRSLYLSRMPIRLSLWFSVTAWGLASQDAPSKSLVGSRTAHH